MLLVFLGQLHVKKIQKLWFNYYNNQLTSKKNKLQKGLHRDKPLSLEEIVVLFLFI